MDILYQDEYIIVLNKPADLSVLPEGWEPDAPYLRQMLESEFGRIWVVHRLDKFTSGVMVFARTAEAHRELNGQFERHEVEKVYHAIVEDIPLWEEKVCKMPLRVNVGHKHRTAIDHKRGKPAETHFKVIKRGYPGGHKQDRALVKARPKTGRTHHLSGLGFPLLGDILYGASETDLIMRPALHALSLTFTHPSSRERVTFSAPYPEDMQQLLERLSI